MRRLYHAAHSGSLSDVIRVIDDGKHDIDERNDNGWTPLMGAVRRNSLANVQVLVENGASLNAVADDGHTAFFEAVYSRLPEIAKFLVAHGAIVDRRLKPGLTTALHWAARHNDDDMLQLIFDNGGQRSVDQQSSSGKTPLHWAAKYGSLEACEILLENGADTTIKDNKNKTAKDLAQNKASGPDSSYQEVANAIDRKEKGEESE